MPLPLVCIILAVLASNNNPPMMCLWCLQHEEAMLDFRSRIWVTYRRGFPEIGGAAGCRIMP